MKIKFSDLAVGQQFTCNGNRYVKHSYRTAQFVDFNRWSFFGKSDICEVEK